MEKRTLKQIISALLMVGGVGLLVYSSKMGSSTGFAVKEVATSPASIFALSTGIILFIIGYLLFRNTRY
jgi:hypothetical protein